MSIQSRTTGGEARKYLGDLNFGEVFYWIWTYFHAFLFSFNMKGFIWGVERGTPTNTPTPTTVQVGKSTFSMHNILRSKYQLLDITLCPESFPSNN